MDREVHLIEPGWNHLRIDHPLEYNRESILALGCSCTWGVGVERDETWSSVLQAKMRMPVYNLGFPGGSADSVFRLLSNHLPIIQSRIVCIQSPSDFRFEVNHNPIGGWNVEDLGYGDLLSEKEVAINKKKNYYAIIEMCRRYDTEIRFFRSSNWEDNPRHLEGDPAGTDGIHPGVRWHKAVADFFVTCPTDLNRIYNYVD